MQDVYTLRKLADAHNMDHFLNHPILMSDDKDLSIMSDLAGNISQALRNTMLRPAPDRPSPRRSSQALSKVRRGQETTILTPRSKSDEYCGESKRCSFCGVTETPRWRGRSSGCLLCNVCGLVKSRRLIRKYLASARRGSHLSQTPRCSA